VSGPRLAPRSAQRGANGRVVEAHRRLRRRHAPGRPAGVFERREGGGEGPLGVGPPRAGHPPHPWVCRPEGEAVARQRLRLFLEAFRERVVPQRLHLFLEATSLALRRLDDLLEATGSRLAAAIASWKPR